MSDNNSDLDKKAPVLPKIVTTEKEKKWTTKMMIKDALIELSSRKGVSVYAIKKHLTDKFQVDTERLNYVIKKTLKAGVEDGTFVQIKGVGASGSFKLVISKEKVKKTIKKKKLEKTGKEMKELKKKVEKSDKPKEKLKKVVIKTKQKNIEIETEKIATQDKLEKKEKKSKAKKVIVKESAMEEKGKKTKVNKVISKEKETKEKKTKGAKIAKEIVKTPKKRANMMKRKSIGSIRKPPKMKPK